MDETIQAVAEAVKVAVPVATTLVTYLYSSKQAKKHAARQSILQLILEDKMAVMEGKLPENRQAILEEFDEYTKAGGNSYVHRKVDEYEEWFKFLEQNK